MLAFIPHEQLPPQFITPHAQCERGKVIDHGVHIYNIYIYIYIYICLWTKKIFESYFRD